MIKLPLLSRYRLTVRTQDSQSCNLGSIPSSGTILSFKNHNVIFSLTHSPNKKIEEWYEESMKELGEFYGINWKEGRPIILLLNSRKDVDLIKGRKTEDWVAGFTLGAGKSIFLISPEKLEEESVHKYSDEEYSRRIKHELSHLFSRRLYRGFTPKWLVEGIAIYSSGQLDLKRRPEKFKSFLGSFKQIGSGLYGEAGFAVEILIENFGKEKFFNLYKSLDKVDSEEDLSKLFEDIYGETLNYEFFNQYL
jgi:hypothetical protein